MTAMTNLPGSSLSPPPTATATDATHKTSSLAYKYAFSLARHYTVLYSKLQKIVFLARLHSDHYTVLYRKLQKIVFLARRHSDHYTVLYRKLQKIVFSDSFWEGYC
jgi:hypothetical protein